MQGQPLPAAHPPVPAEQALVPAQAAIEDRGQFLDQFRLAQQRRKLTGGLDPLDVGDLVGDPPLLGHDLVGAVRVGHGERFEENLESVLHRRLDAAHPFLKGSAVETI